MASIALPSIQPLGVMPTDSFTLITLKNSYNTLLSNMKELTKQMNNQSNTLGTTLTQFNTSIGQLNDLAKNINSLQPTAQVSAQQAVSNLTITVDGQVNLV